MSKITILKPFDETKPKINRIAIPKSFRKWVFNAELKDLELTDTLEDLQAQIDEFKDQTEIYKIIDRYQKGSLVPLSRDQLSQIDELHPRSPEYADISQAPQNIHEFKAQIKKAQETLDALSKVNLDNLNQAPANANNSNNSNNTINEKEKVDSNV